jgi:tritrans,polycis-undecaprenyl-diphosphate synthase [geranylgeranyl-diphosphate specific]
MKTDEKALSPSHVGIIMDGNRRYARKRALSPWKGHEFGARKLEQVLEWSRELGIRELTLYTLSIQNFDRPKAEVEYLMNLFRSNFSSIKKDERIAKHQIRINIIGRLSMFPEDIQKMMRDIMEQTRTNDKYILNFAMGYGGREEIVDAAKKISRDVKAGKISPEDITPESFSRYLYLQDEPDLIIRTGGETRTSNFLMWQSSYSEWVFLDKMWPELEKSDIESSIAEYASRKRRFGK